MIDIYDLEEGEVYITTTLNTEKNLVIFIDYINHIDFSTKYDYTIDCTSIEILITPFGVSNCQYSEENSFTESDDMTIQRKATGTEADWLSDCINNYAFGTIENDVVSENLYYEFNYLLHYNLNENNYAKTY